MNLILLLLLSSIVVLPQTISELRIIGNGETLPSEIIANENRDKNGEVCAGLRIISDLDGLKYDSNNGIVKTDLNPGNDLLFLSQSERVVTVFKSGYASLKIILSEYGIKLKSGEVWQIKITGDKKTDLIPITIITNTEDALFVIDGVKKGSEKTQQISIGKHQLIIEKKGYKTIADEIDVNYQNAFFNYTLEKIKPVKYTIRTTPSEAKIYINDVEKGESDIQNFDYPGVYKLLLTKTGYLDISKEIEITEKGANEFSFQLIKNKGILSISVIPALATIKINDEIKSGKDIELAQGKYQIEISAPGHFSKKEEVTIEIGKTVVKNFTLQKNTSLVIFEVDPSEAKILINGKDYSRQKSIELPQGNYLIETEQEGYIKKEEYISVELNKPITKKIKLEAKTGTLQFTIKPIEAEVDLIKNEKIVFSWKGANMLNDLMIGEYKIKAKLSGYKSEVKIVLIKTALETIINMDLVKGSDISEKINKCGDKLNYSGKIYNTVQIGVQCWLKENLDIGTMLNGKDAQVDNGVIEKYCYDNSTENCEKFGGLYQWDEAMQYSKNEGTQGICPNGWHIPTKEQYETLRLYVNNSRDALLALGQSLGKDTHSFSAMLAGLVYSNEGSFYGLGGYTTFWSSTEFNTSTAYDIYLNNHHSNIILYSNLKTNGFSIRCLKDK